MFHKYHRSTLGLFIIIECSIYCWTKVVIENELTNLKEIVANLSKTVNSYQDAVKEELSALNEELRIQLRNIEKKIQVMEGGLKKPVNETPFIVSKPFKNGKVYLHPVLAKEKRGDWFKNQRICEKYDVEMVSIHSEEENVFFHNWAYSEVDMVHPGLWLAAQVFFKDKNFLWRNELVPNYVNLAPWEFNEEGITCLNLGWDKEVLYWYNFYCEDARFFIVCQK